MLCIFPLGFLSCMQENLMVLIAFYSLDHSNKHFPRFLKKLEEMKFLCRMVEEQSLYFNQILKSLSSWQLQLTISIAVSVESKRKC